MAETQPDLEKVSPIDSDDDVWHSSDEEEEDKGPPPMLNIEKSADLKSMKTAIQNAIEKPCDVKQPKPFADFENRIGMENWSTLTHTFEKIGDSKERSPKPQPIVAADKEQYTSFKEKFENIDKLKAEEQDQDSKALKAAMDIQGLGAQGLSKAIDIFNPDSEEKSKNCAICDKIVYPVERILVDKRIFHKNCFNCKKCQKRLDLQTYSIHEENIYCKLHALEIFRPEVALAYQKGELTDGEIEAEFDEDGDYVLVSKPRVHDASIVKSSLKSADDFDSLGSLQSRKSEWTKSAQEMGKPDKKTIAMDENEAKLFEQGRVKAHSTKFVEGDMGTDQQVDEMDEQVTDSGIVRSSKKKEKVSVHVGTKAITSKWETGTVERAQGETEDRTQELDEIKKNVSIKERFKEKTDNMQSEQNEDKRKSTIDDEAIDTSFSHAAKESFLKGTAFQDTKPVEKVVACEDIKFSEMGNVKERFEKRPLDDEGKTTEKTVVDVRCTEMGGIKAAFEQKQPIDEEAKQTRKKEQIEKEFQQIKQTRKQLKQARKKSESDAKENKTTDIIGDESISLKDKFETGSFEGEKGKKVDKAKFQSVDKDGTCAASSAAATATKTLEQSKWTKEPKAKPEPVNKRIPSAEEHESDNDDDDYEVKNLLNKFKDIEQGKADERKGPKAIRRITPPPGNHIPEPKGEIKEKEIISTVSAEELAGIKVEAKNLKAKFEHAAAAVEKAEADVSLAEEKKRQLEEEFKKLKEMKEELKHGELADNIPAEEQVKEKDADLALAAEHGQKSRAKWEKIERKEAKKSQKAAAVARRPAQNAKLES